MAIRESIAKRLLHHTCATVVNRAELAELKHRCRVLEDQNNRIAGGEDRLDMMWGIQNKTYDNNGMPRIDFSKPLGKRQKELLYEGLKQYVLCSVAEAMEMLNWTTWKHWSVQLGNKKQVEQFGEEHLKEMREEVADQLAFLFSQAMVLGMTPKILFDVFVHKLGTIVQDRAKDPTY